MSSMQSNCPTDIFVANVHLDDIYIFPFIYTNIPLEELIFVNWLVVWLVIQRHVNPNSVIVMALIRLQANTNMYVKMWHWNDLSKVVSSNPAHGEVYWIQHYVIRWHAVGMWFSPVSSNNITDRHDITEILLTVALNTLTLE